MCNSLTGLNPSTEDPFYSERGRIYGEKAFRFGVVTSGHTSRADLTRSREVVDAFLAASREGSFDALLAVLDPNVVFRHDRITVPAGASREVRGALAVARQFSGRAQGARPALVNGSVGIVVARRGRLFLVLSLTIRYGKIVGRSTQSADPARLRQLRLSVLDD